MPKKNEELRAKAKQLYEQEGLSLAEIARKLNINNSTVKNWKSRDKWVKPKNESIESKNESKKPDKKAKRIQNPNSLANLEPPFEPDNKVALKHGLTANNTDQPEYDKYLSEVSELSEEEIARKVVDMSLANLLTAMDVYGAGSPQFLEAFTRVTSMIANMAEKPGKIHSTNLDNRMKEFEIEKLEQQLSGTSPQLEVLKAYIEAVKLDAARDSKFDSEEDPDSGIHP